MSDMFKKDDVVVAFYETDKPILLVVCDNKYMGNEDAVLAKTISSGQNIGWDKEYLRYATSVDMIKAGFEADFGVCTIPDKKRYRLNGGSWWMKKEEVKVGEPKSLTLEDLLCHALNDTSFCRGEEKLTAKINGILVIDKNGVVTGRYYGREDEVHIKYAKYTATPPPPKESRVEPEKATVTMGWIKKYIPDFVLKRRAMKNMTDDQIRRFLTPPDNGDAYNYAVLDEVVVPVELEEGK